jgi:site-specific recombinase XerD
MSPTGFAAPLMRASLFLAEPQAGTRFWEFFTAHIRNSHTRRAYFHAAGLFSNWCHGRELGIERVRPIHVAAYVEELGAAYSKPTVKQHLAALRMLFDWLVSGGVLPVNPASSVRGPKHSVKRGKTPVLSAEEMGQLLASIDVTELKGLRDRALIALMAYSFARVGAAITLRVEDYYLQGRRGWIRLQEKGGKVNEMPCHHNLEKYLDEWLAATKLVDDAGAPLFPSFRNGVLTRVPLAQTNVHQMVRLRAAQAGIRTKLNCHSFRATGITTYLRNGGKLEIAQQMAGHESARTTGLYDRRNDTVALDEVERITY